MAKRLHPDLGGDADAFVRALREIDSPDAAPTSPPPPITPTGITPTGIAARSGRRLRAAARSVRTRLPRRLPGARRYVDLRPVPKETS